MNCASASCRPSKATSASSSHSRTPLRITFLGTGTSHGVPMIGCDCGTCRSTDPHDKRWRASVYVETDDGQALLVDAGPDVRMQSLTFDVRRVDAIIFTHGHADHI